LAGSPKFPDLQLPHSNQFFSCFWKCCEKPPPFLLRTAIFPPGSFSPPFFFPFTGFDRRLSVLTDFSGRHFLTLFPSILCLFSWSFLWLRCCNFFDALPPSFSVWALVRSPSFRLVFCPLLTPQFVLPCFSEPKGFEVPYLRWPFLVAVFSLKLFS